MAFSHGSKAELSVTVSGTATFISQYLTSASLAQDADTAEVSGLTDTAKEYIKGLSDGTIPLEGSYDPTVDDNLYTIFSGSAGTTAFAYYPAGTASGAVKYSGTAILTKYEGKSDIGDAGKISGELQVTGAITRATV